MPHSSYLLLLDSSLNSSVEASHSWGEPEPAFSSFSKHSFIGDKIFHRHVSYCGTFHIQTMTCGCVPLQVHTRSLEVHLLMWLDEVIRVGPHNGTRGFLGRHRETWARHLSHSMTSCLLWKTWVAKHVLVQCSWTFEPQLWAKWPTFFINYPVTGILSQQWKMDEDT